MPQHPSGARQRYDVRKRKETKKKDKNRRRREERKEGEERGCCLLGDRSGECTEVVADALVVEEGSRAPRCCCHR